MPLLVTGATVLGSGALAGWANVATPVPQVEVPQGVTRHTALTHREWLKPPDTLPGGIRTVDDNPLVLADWVDPTVSTTVLPPGVTARPPPPAS